MEVDMPHPARTALVLQGGGALGAYELGAARRLYKDGDFSPDVVAGVSIGAITAVLLARPAKGMKPVEALEAFWQKVTVAAPFVPLPLRPYASAFGNPSFFMPRLDYYAFPSWTNIYDTEPLRQTLSQLVDLEALADPKASPGLLVSATDVVEGQIEYFYSGDRRALARPYCREQQLAAVFSDDGDRRQILLGRRFVRQHAAWRGAR
jgi:NTE family protein